MSADEVVVPRFTPSDSMVAVKEKIDDFYRALMHPEDRLGWAYIYSKPAALEQPKLVTIGLNPGGGRGDHDWQADANLTLDPAGEHMNAYFDQPWLSEGRFTQLQKQIQKLQEQHFLAVEPEDILSFQLVPIRSPRWDEMPAAYRNPAIRLGLNLLDWTLRGLSADTTVVAFGLAVAERDLVKWFEGHSVRHYRTGWGNVTARVYSTRKAGKLVMLPHLSIYRVIGRDQFLDAPEVFG